PVIQSNSASSELSGRPLGDLKAGQLCPVILEVANIGPPSGSTGTVQLAWQSPTVAKAIISAANLLPAAVLTAFASTYTFLHKVGMVVHGLKLTPKDLSYFAAHTADFDFLDFGGLPLSHTDANQSQIDSDAPKHFARWQRLNHYSLLRKNLPDGDISLVDVFA